MRLTVIYQFLISTYKFLHSDRRLTWLKPFVAPRVSRLGDAAAMNMKTAPVE
jgi:hypothetical protein